MRLRKLTKKSIMGFGKYRDMSVQNLLLMNSGYLVWAYYNASHITFFKDILTEIGIHKNIMFEKPGRNEELFQRVFDEKLLIFKKNRTGTRDYIYFINHQSKAYLSNQIDYNENSKSLNRNRNQWRSK